MCVMSNKKLSIITINYNNCKGLEKTINSVFKQNNKNFEYIIIDGKSSDKSIDVIYRNLNLINNWISEIDSGIYHAMNKGIKMATGDYILFLNSGDYLYNNNVTDLIIKSKLDVDILYGNLCHIDNKKSSIFYYPKNISIQYLWKYSLPHPSSLFNRKLFEKVGFYNESDKITSDWQFYMTAIYLYNCSVKKINIIISIFNGDGISNAANSNRIIQTEKKIFMDKYFAKYNEQLLNLTISHEDILRNFKHKYLTKILFKLGFYKEMKSYIEKFNS
jgi:glycosyltransferase involved in cell wall biosynthesis